jgi:hypothetical protein
MQNLVVIEPPTPGLRKILVFNPITLNMPLAKVREIFLSLFMGGSIDDELRDCYGNLNMGCP